MADFYFKTNKFQNLLLQIPKSLRIPVTLFLLIVLCIIWFITLYKPLQNSYQTALMHYTTLNSLQGMQSKIEKKNKKIEKHMSKKNSLINNLKRDLPEQEFINKTIANLFTCAHEAHISVIRHTPIKAEDNGLYLSSYFCDELHGSFEHITTFLQFLSEKKVALQPSCIKIAKQNLHTLSLILDYSINTIKDADGSI